MITIRKTDEKPTRTSNHVAYGKTVGFTWSELKLRSPLYARWYYVDDSHYTDEMDEGYFITFRKPWVWVDNWRTVIVEPPDPIAAAEWAAEQEAESQRWRTAYQAHIDDPENVPAPNIKDFGYPDADD